MNVITVGQLELACVSRVARERSVKNFQICREESWRIVHKTTWGASEHLQLAANDDA